jgi:hypothetical protein
MPLTPEQRESFQQAAQYAAQVVVNQFQPPHIHTSRKWQEAVMDVSTRSLNFEPAKLLKVCSAIRMPGWANQLSRSVTGDGGKRILDASSYGATFMTTRNRVLCSPQRSVNRTLEISKNRRRFIQILLRWITPSEHRCSGLWLHI